MTPSNRQKTFYLTHAPVVEENPPFFFLHKLAYPAPARIKLKRGTLKADFGFERDCNTHIHFKATFSKIRRVLESCKYGNRQTLQVALQRMTHITVFPISVAHENLAIFEKLEQHLRFRRNNHITKQRNSPHNIKRKEKGQDNAKT